MQPPFSRHRRRLLGAALLLAGPAALAADAQSARAPAVAALVGGVWTADQRSAGGLGDSFAFHSDGSVTYGFAAIVDMRYVIEGATIRASTEQPDGGRQAVDFPFEFRDGTLLLQSGQPAHTLTLRRSPEGRTTHADGVVGAWDFTSPLGAPARLRFTSDGRAQMLTYLKRSAGRYDMREGKLTLTLTGAHAPRTFNYRLDPGRLDQGRLVLGATGPGGEVRTFTHLQVK